MEIDKYEAALKQKFIIIVITILAGKYEINKIV